MQDGISSGFVIGIELLSQMHQYQQAAQVAGKALQLRQEMGAPLAHPDQLTFNSLEAQLQQTLGMEDWEEQTQLGQTLSNAAVTALLEQATMVQPGDPDAVA